MKNLEFSNKILNWYFQEKRELPWRNSSDPYRIWISEIILQQTRIEQGTSYYIRFIGRYPTVYSLAGSTEDEVLKLWQGLGYYSRARNLFLGAQQIVNDYHGKFPTHSSDWKKIKGIGDYAAAAIASIAFNEPVVAIDGNVYRVLSRVFGINAPIDTTFGKKLFSELANGLMDKNNPGDYNQAVMEFGALLCKPKPLCANCPFLNQCIAYRSQTIATLPVKSKKTKQRNRFFYYLFIEQDNAIFFKKREENDIWKNLYDFPLIESSEKKSIEDITKTTTWLTFFENATIEIRDVSKEEIHLLTHQKIYVQFVHLKLKTEKFLPTNFIKMDKRNIFELAVPKIIENFLMNLKTD